MIRPNRARHALAAGELALGMVLRQARTVDIAGLANAAGFDWFSIDMEHATIDTDTAAQIVNAALGAGITPLVRVPSRDHDALGRLLDAGAQGAIIPHVRSAADARAAVARCKYPPQGERSYAGALPHLGYAAIPAQEAMRTIDAETMVIAMLESPEAVAAAGAIAAVEGIDVLMIGINDLANALGAPGRFDDPRIVRAFDEVVTAARAHGRQAGMSGIHAPALVKRYIDAGVRFIGCGTDQSFLLNGATERARSVRATFARGEKK